MDRMPAQEENQLPAAKGNPAMTEPVRQAMRRQVLAVTVAATFLAGLAARQEVTRHNPGFYKVPPAQSFTIEPRTP